ncbi:hypothetical protein BT69DRAFT_1278385 [Atractiella rhizophila]|nr:hypothetical protein BT69DRAFT_1278385 [Atractiella rhizophila]
MAEQVSALSSTRGFWFTKYCLVLHETPLFLHSIPATNKLDNWQHRRVSLPLQSFRLLAVDWPCPPMSNQLKTAALATHSRFEFVTYVDGR